LLGLLKRHEVEILLKAGHKRTEVARLTGISPSSVQRIAGEAPIEHFNDTAERRNRRIGRPSIVKQRLCEGLAVTVGPRANDRTGP
jgi:hypothetical protein